jgi:spore maturation protein CgeB
MKIVLFYHSLISDWNHGNAHFLRGICTSLQKIGHEVQVYEPQDGWSLSSLIKDSGRQAVEDFERQFPNLKANFYAPEEDFQPIVRDADLVIVHEWNEPSLVKEMGKLKLLNDFVLLFHDTHHRGVSAKEEMKKYDLRHYDGVLAFGKTLQEVYQEEGWHKNTWVWHEAADLSTYTPKENIEKIGDLVWIGNWGDEERTKELHEYIIEPVKALKLKAKFYGVRYPKHALKSLEEAGIEYGGYLPTAKVAETFAQYKATVHVPRKFYRERLWGIPTIRPFEALACKIPLLSAPWQDSEGLFTINKDFLMAESGEEMTHMLHEVLTEKERTRQMTAHGYETILARHTCDHRAEELMNIYTECLHIKTQKEVGNE